MYDISERCVQGVQEIQLQRRTIHVHYCCPDHGFCCYSCHSLARKGRPDARGLVVHQTPDQLVSSGFWQCSPSKFTWEFTWDEFVCVIEGRVTISDNQGNTLTLGPGDVASFAKGLSTTWHVQEQVRKFFVIRTSESLET